MTRVNIRYFQATYWIFVLYKIFPPTFRYFPLFMSYKLHGAHRQKIDAQTVRSVARELVSFCLLSQRRLDTIKLANNNPVCQQSQTQGLLLRRTSRFVPSGGTTHCTNPRKDGQAEWACTDTAYYCWADADIIFVIYYRQLLHYRIRRETSTDDWRCSVVLFYRIMHRISGCDVG